MYVYVLREHTILCSISVWHTGRECVHMNIYMYTYMIYLKCMHTCVNVCIYVAWYTILCSMWVRHTWRERVRTNTYIYTYDKSKMCAYVLCDHSIFWSLLACDAQRGCVHMHLYTQCVCKCMYTCCMITQQIAHYEHEMHFMSAYFFSFFFAICIWYAWTSVLWLQHSVFIVMGWLRSVGSMKS